MSNKLIEVFDDTLKLISNDKIIRCNTDIACSSTKVYKENFVSLKRSIKSSTVNIEVNEQSTFRCAYNCVGSGKTAVLNFANPYDAGGGVKGGCVAQEESLCRCSNLYKCLLTETAANDFYEYHKGLTGYVFSDRIIYSPNVTVFKDDNYNLLDNYYNVDVITCAAPYNGYKIDEEVLKKTYISRIKNIFEVAMDNEVDNIVLGAFGCGEFFNSPQLMAEAFKYCIANEYYKYFKKIYFAILQHGKALNRNYVVFNTVLQNDKEIRRENK